MDSGQADLEKVAAELREWPSVFFRLLLRRAPETTWITHRLLIDAVPEGSGLSSRSSFRYIYDDIAVLAGREEGRVVALWLTQTGQRTVETTDAYGVAESFLFAMQGMPIDMLHSVPWLKYISAGDDYIGPLRWPHRVFSVTLQSSPQSIPDRLFVAEGCPFFPSIGSLVNSLVYGNDEEY